MAEDSRPAPAEAIRELASLEELRAAVRLQEETWGDGFAERVPVSILKVTRRLGGVVAGAFDDAGALVGFVFGITGLEAGEPVHWSDMLAVRPDHRNRGLGRRLKLWQRDRCLALGVRRMYWTFDPLESRNAWLNLGRLGAVVREYVVDMYGASDSPLHRGLGTDRLIALWLLDDERVRRRLGGDAPPPTRDELGAVPLAFPVEQGPTAPRHAPAAEGPGSAAADGEAPGDAVLVPIPVDIQVWKDDDPDLARAWREAVRAALRPRLDAGWEVRELVPSSDGLSYYLLCRPAEAP